MDVQELERHLQQLLEPDRLPANIKSARFELGTDHIGEPAIRVYLEIEPDVLAILEKDKERRDELGRFRQDLASRILELESGYFPFIRLSEAA